jgi:hypothetical protein
LSCAICETRKEKRFCPAVHGKICAVCCGESREVTLDCPAECPYLQQARRFHQPPAPEELGPEVLFGKVSIDATFLQSREQLYTGLAFGLVKLSRADRNIRDQEALAALSTLAKKYQTLVDSGLHIEPPTTNPVQQAIMAELEQMLAGFREIEQKNTGYTSLKDSDVLKALVFLVRTALSKSSGRPRSRGFLDFLAARFPDEKGLLAPQDAESRLILP